VLRLRTPVLFEAVIFLAAAGVFLCVFPSAASAVVGRAEEFDPFEWENLIEFQDGLAREEGPELARQNIGDQLMSLDAQKAEAATAEEKADYDAIIKSLQQQILNIPKPDRFRFEISGDYRYDTNVIRAIPGQEKDDSIFNADGTLLIDLSGRKTDLRLETVVGKLWDIEFPTSDMMRLEERVRYRRRYFRKISHSSNFRFAKTDTKTIEINRDKIRLDAQWQNSINYAFSPKLSLNLDNNYSRRVFTQKPFTKDSGWENTINQSAFWNVTPKSRISAGYGFGMSRNLQKSSDANSQNVTLGYFGRVTRKSSASLNTGWSRQKPLKQDSVTNTWTLGLGYVWQATYKSQLAFQAIRSLQNTTSVSNSNDADGNPIATRTDTWITNDSLSASLNSRLTRKINVGVNLNMSWVRRHMSRDQKQAADEEGLDPETQQITFPSLTVTVNYLISRWVTLTCAYEFANRWGDEKQDLYRDTVWRANLRIVF
jgi:hypothetical protein